MIFEGLSDKLQGALGKLKSKGKLTEKDVVRHKLVQSIVKAYEKADELKRKRKY